MSGQGFTQGVAQGRKHQVVGRPRGRAEREGSVKGVLYTHVSVCVQRCRLAFAWVVLRPGNKPNICAVFYTCVFDSSPKLEVGALITTLQMRKQMPREVAHRVRQHRRASHCCLLAGKYRLFSHHHSRLRGAESQNEKGRMAGSQEERLPSEASPWGRMGLRGTAQRNPFPFHLVFRSFPTFQVTFPKLGILGSDSNANCCSKTRLSGD